MRNSFRFLILSIVLAITSISFAAKDPIYNPRAVKHQIDRSAMRVQIQGWTRDLKYPVYPISVIAGGSSVYYETKIDVVPAVSFGLDELACEIGVADKEVLKNPKYSCKDGVCFSNDAGAIIGVDPRKKIKRVIC